jgi:hypothetical protein
MLATNLTRRRAFHFWMLISVAWITTGAWYLLGPVRQEILFAQLISPQIADGYVLVPVDCNDNSALKQREPEVKASGFCWYLLSEVRGHCGTRWIGDQPSALSCGLGVRQVFLDDSAPLERPLYHNDIKIYKAFYSKANLLRSPDLKTTASIIGRSIVTLVQGPIIVLLSGWLIFRTYSSKKAPV